MIDLSTINTSHVGPDGGHGNPTEFIGFGIVGFVDLLGFSASANDHWGTSAESPLARLLRIKSAARKLPEHQIVNHVGGTSENWLSVCRIHTVSDSIAVCAALPNEGKRKDLVSAAHVVALSMQLAWAAAIDEGFTVRGALELGKIYWDQNETIGPAFNAAYSLETKVARTSRIIVGPNYLSKLLEILKIDGDANEWANWPSANWYTASEDNLIEIAPHTLRETQDRYLVKLEAISKKSGQLFEDRYEGILNRLRSRQPDTAATLSQLERGGVLATDILSGKRD